LASEAFSVDITYPTNELRKFQCHSAASPLPGPNLHLKELAEKKLEKVELKPAILGFGAEFALVIKGEILT
jgi:hypothetical protein